MKSTLCLGFLLVASNAAPSLKKLLQANDFVTVSQNAGDYGFNWTCDNSSVIIPPPIIPPGGGSNPDSCNCDIAAGSTGAGLPTLGQA